MSSLEKRLFESFAHFLIALFAFWCEFCYLMWRVTAAEWQTRMETRRLQALIPPQKQSGRVYTITLEILSFYLKIFLIW